jgi:acetyl esterase/lipase
MKTLGLGLLLFLFYSCHTGFRNTSANAIQFQGKLISPTEAVFTFIPPDSIVMDSMKIVYDTCRYPEKKALIGTPTHVSPTATKAKVVNLIPGKTYYFSIMCHRKLENKWSSKESIVNQTIVLTTDTSYSVTYDIAYGKAYSDIRKLDIFQAKTNRKNKTVLFIHGGGWRAGAKWQWEPVARYFARQGFDCVSATYRLAPEHPFPACIEDVRLAMAWVKQHGQQYGMNTEKIGVVGSSAGGHLIALLSTIGPEDSLGVTQELSLRDTRPAATVCYNPITNFTATWEGRGKSHNEMYKDLFNGTLEEKRALYELASPALRLTGKEPPFLFIQGTEDKLTPKHIPEDMIKRLKKVGVSAQLLMFEGMAHGFGYTPRHPEQIRAMVESAKYLDKHLTY